MLPRRAALRGETSLSGRPLEAVSATLETAVGPLGLGGGCCSATVSNSFNGEVDRAVVLLAGVAKLATLEGCREVEEEIICPL